jgi:hypothetical protein
MVEPRYKNDKEKQNKSLQSDMAKNATQNKEEKLGKKKNQKKRKKKKYLNLLFAASDPLRLTTEG